MRFHGFVGVAGLLFFLAGQGQGASLAPEDATPTTNTDVSSFIATGCGYDAWTGSARRVVHDIFPVAGSIAAGGLKVDRTYSSHNNALEQPNCPRIPGEQQVAARLSYTWSMRGRDGVNFSSDTYVVHFPDGRVEGFHSPTVSGIPGETAWRSGFGTKERLFFPTGIEGATADLYLEDGSVVHFDHYTDVFEGDLPCEDELSGPFDVFTPRWVTDPQGLITTFTMEQIPGTVEAYETRLKKVTDPSGQSLTYIYGTNGGCTQITASDGQWVKYAPSYEVAATVTYSDGTSASYTYDTISTTDPDTGQPGAPVLVWKTAQDMRAEGPMQSILYTYRNNNPPPKFGGQIISEANLSDGVLVSTFTSTDARTTATDTRGDGPSRILSMSKTGKTPLLRWKNDFDGVPESFYYDGYNYLSKFTDRRGASTDYNNEAILGRPTKITYPDALDGNGRPTEVYHYSFKGIPDDTANPYFVYSLKDENGKITYYDRDNLNRIVAIRYPDGGSEAFTYDSRSRVLSHQKQNGWYEFADYDTTGKMTFLWNPVNSAANPKTQAKTIYTYYTAPNAWAGRVKDVTDPLGHKTTYEYDLSFDPATLNQPCPGRGLVTRITHNVDNSFKSFVYDQFGNKLFETDETGRTTSFTYDAYNRLKSMALPGQAPTTYDYSKGSSPYSHTSKSVALETSASGVKTARTFDANLRLSTETVASGVAGVAATTYYDYDENGNETIVTDPPGMQLGDWNYSTTTAYDSRNRKTSVTSPPTPLGAEVTSWHYDKVGNVIGVDRPDGGVENRTYDAMNRLKTEAMLRDPGTLCTMTFDYNLSGTLQKVTDGNSKVTTFDYNSNADGANNGYDLKSKATYPDTSFELWTYDTNKNIRSRQTTAGDVEMFSYDTRDRLWTKGWQGAPTWANGATYENIYAYDYAGRLESASNAVSVVTRTYDEAGRLWTDTQTFLNSSLPAHTVEYTHRDDGNVTAVQLDRTTDSNDPFHFIYTYDGMGRLKTLTNENNTGPDHEYSYDLASNVTQRFNHLFGDYVVYNYDNLNRMTQREIRLSDGTTWSSEQYGFDQMNRETSVTRAEDGSTDTFTYNYSGELTSAQYATGVPPTPTPTPTPSATPTPTATPTPKVATPTYNPTSSSNGGSPPSDLSVAISTTTSGATIRYTTDGVTNPSKTVGTVYTAPVVVAKSTSQTLKAIAYKTGSTDSNIATSTFNRITVAATPTFNPPSSTGSHPPAELVVSVSTTSPAAQMRWTNDGTNPTTTKGNFINGSLGEIHVYSNTTKTLKAIAYGNGYGTSGIVSGSFDQTDHAPFAAAPVFSPGSSSGSSPPTDLSVHLTTGSTGASMRYTLDGTIPTPLYGFPISGTSGYVTIPASTVKTLKALAYGAAYQNSTVTSAVFDRVDHTTTCVPPAFSPVGQSEGQHPPVPLAVGLSTTTTGASLLYTLDGSTPTTSPLHGTTISATSGTVWIGINAIKTLKALAFKTGSYNSLITSGYYDNTDPGGGGNSPVHDGDKRSRQGSRQTQMEQMDSVRTVDYTLDTMGNRTKVVDAGTTKTYTVNSLNQYSKGDSLTVSNGPSHEISSYNLTNYYYIGDSYLAKASLGNNSYTLFYDALGRCVKRTSVVNGGTSTTNYYVFDGEHWVMEYDGDTGSNTSVSLYGRGIDELIARGKGPQGYFYFQDRNGNTSVVTNGTTGIFESYRYDAFGTPTIYDSDGVPLVATAIGNRFLFTGREWNPTYGFYEYRARAYNPALGRFMSEDPKGFDAGDYNLYRYCSNDPLDKSDPMGLEGLVIVYRQDGVSGTSNPVSTFENGRYQESFLGNRNGFLPNPQTGRLTHGPQEGSYVLLPKPGPAVQGEFRPGTPSITAPQYADPNRADYAPGRAGPDYKKEGTVRVHAESSNGSPDSTGCLTCKPENVAAVKGLMDRNLNNGGTTIIFVNGRATLDGHEVRRAEPVLQKTSQ